MATKDISDLQVVQAFAEMEGQIDATRGTNQRFEYADDILMRTTGQPEKVCLCAMERAYKRGFVECGMWLRGGWLTKEGWSLLVEMAAKI